MPSAGNGDIYEIGVKIPSESSGKTEILREMLVGIGFEWGDIAESIAFPFTVLTVYSRSKAKAAHLKRRLKSYRLRNVIIESKRLKRDDWQAKWKKDFKPFNLTKKFAVIPSRYKNSYPNKGKRLPLYIDTNMAFGTGLHPTTRFMAELVERYAPKCNTFLDIGTGTGILAMIAHKCGVSNVQAIDISPDSIKVAKANFKENKCDSIKLEIEDVHKRKSRKKFDFLCANIITHDLIQMADRIIPMVRRGKYLALSGISINSYPILRKAYAAFPLRCLRVKRGDGWSAVLFKKI